MNEQLVVKKLIEIDGKLDQTVRLADFEKYRLEQLQANDQMISILQRLDQERIFNAERTKTLEEEMGSIKLQLKTA